MAESDIIIVPQDQTVNDRLVVLSDFQTRRGYRFDAVTQYGTQRSYRPTKHSVPSGAAITDHVSRDPLVFRLVGVLTPYNVVSLAGVGGAFASAVEGSDALEAALLQGSDSALDLIRKNRDQLVQFADEFTLLTVLGNEFQYANMIITRINDPKTPALGDSYQLTVSFREIRIALESSRIAPLIDADADSLGGGEVKDVGQ
jgi:hypothetical protein